MILVDTSVWIDHLRRGDAELIALLNEGQVLIHPFVIGELALGNLQNRDIVISTLQNLPPINAASDNEVMHFHPAQHPPRHRHRLHRCALVSVCAANARHLAMDARQAAVGGGSEVRAVR